MRAYLAGAALALAVAGAHAQELYPSGSGSGSGASALIIPSTETAPFTFTSPITGASYQWSCGGSPIGGATSRTYTASGACSSLTVSVTSNGSVVTMAFIPSVNMKITGDSYPGLAGGAIWSTSSTYANILGGGMSMVQQMFGRMGFAAIPGESFNSALQGTTTYWLQYIANTNRSDNGSGCSSSTGASLTTPTNLNVTALGTNGFWPYAEVLVGGTGCRVGQTDTGSYIAAPVSGSYGGVGNYTLNAATGASLSGGYAAVSANPANAITAQVADGWFLTNSIPGTGGPIGDTHNSVILLNSGGNDLNNAPSIPTTLGNLASFITSAGAANKEVVVMNTRPAGINIAFNETHAINASTFQVTATNASTFYAGADRCGNFAARTGASGAAHYEDTPVILSNASGGLLLDAYTSNANPATMTSGQYNATAGGLYTFASVDYAAGYTTAWLDSCANAGQLSAAGIQSLIDISGWENSSSTSYVGKGSGTAFGIPGALTYANTIGVDSFGLGGTSPMLDLTSVPASLVAGGSATCVSQLGDAGCPVLPVPGMQTNQGAHVGGTGGTLMAAYMAPTVKAVWGGAGAPAQFALPAYNNYYLVKVTSGAQATYSAVLPQSMVGPSAISTSVTGAGAQLCFESQAGSTPVAYCLTASSYAGGVLQLTDVGPGSPTTSAACIVVTASLGGSCNGSTSQVQGYFFASFQAGHIPGGNALIILYGQQTFAWNSGASAYQRVQGANLAVNGKVDWGVPSSTSASGTWQAAGGTLQTITSSANIACASSGLGTSASNYPPENFILVGNAALNTAANTNHTVTITCSYDTTLGTPAFAIDVEGLWPSGASLYLQQIVWQFLNIAQISASMQTSDYSEAFGRFAVSRGTTTYNGNNYLFNLANPYVKFSSQFATGGTVYGIGCGSTPAACTISASQYGDSTYSFDDRALIDDGGLAVDLSGVSPTSPVTDDALHAITVGTFYAGLTPAVGPVSAKYRLMAGGFALVARRP